MSKMNVYTNHYKNFYKFIIVTCKINVTMSELTFQKMGLVGYVIKIEKIFEKPMQSTLAVEKRPKLNYFQFKFDPYRLMYSGEITDIALSELPSQRIEASDIDDIVISHLGDKTSMISDNKTIKFSKNVDELEISLDKNNEKDYAKGIRLLRLVNNKIGDAEEFRIEENEEVEDLESENKQSSLFLQNSSQDDAEYEEDLDNTFKSRKALNQIINNQKIPPVIRNLKYGANVLLLILIAIAFADYFVTYQQFNVE